MHAHTHTELHWHVCNSYTAPQVQDLAVTTVGKSPVQVVPLLAIAKIDEVEDPSSKSQAFLVI